jgi:type 1 glutamine amidotransferase
MKAVLIALTRWMRLRLRAALWRQWSPLLEQISISRPPGSHKRMKIMTFFPILLVPTIYYGLEIFQTIEHSDQYDSVSPVLPRELVSPAILVFSKTNSYRHDSIDAANTMFREIANERGWGIFETENGAVFNAAQVGRFKAVVWNNVSGDVLTPPQQEAFKSYIEAGGGFVGVHGSGGDPAYRWRWYVDTLIGAQFVGHTMSPQFRQATVKIEDRESPIMKGLDATWTRTDEWYSFDSSVRAKGYHVLATLDEQSYHPEPNLSMGPDHPIVWTHCVGSGRAFYSAMGHQSSAYSEPKYLALLTNAIVWAAGIEGSGCW